MPLVLKLIERLQRHPKRVVFAEGADPRVLLQAARQWVTRRMGAPILLGDRRAIKEAAASLSLDTKGMRIIEPEQSEDFRPFVMQLEQLRVAQNLKTANAGEAMKDTSYYATMMLLNAQADALVGGATVSDSSALRPLRVRHARAGRSLSRRPGKYIPPRCARRRNT
jgi:phosphotransacetylase